MDARCRLVVLQFICLVWPSPPHVAVDSFVLRRRSAVDDDQRLADALYAVERFERPSIGYLDDVDQYDILPQDVDDYETEVPGRYVDNQVAENLMDIIKQERDDPDYRDFDDRDYLDNDDETWAEPVTEDRGDLDNIGGSDGDEDEVGSPAEKVSLDKAQLKEMFADAGEQPVDHDVDKKTTQLSKTDVEKLFDNAVTDDKPEVSSAADDSPELDRNASEIELDVPVGSSNGVDELEKTVEELKPDDDDVVGDKLIHVKEETISPVDGKKLTKEWMTELIQEGGDGSSQPSGNGGRKSKRSMDVRSGAEDKVQMAGKQRAVDLLKTYIKLQEEENRHLTKALNLATLAQTQRTDHFIDDEIKHLRHAVGDEAAIETLRSMIRADEDAGEDIEDEMEEQDEEQDGEYPDQEENEDYAATEEQR